MKITPEQSDRSAAIHRLQKEWQFFHKEPFMPTTTQEQPDLFAIDPDTALFPYWRRSMLHWPKEAFMFRHNHNTTGWSMATQGLMFPRMLFRHGQITRAEYRRWWRFDRRLKRIDTTPRTRRPKP